MTNRIRYLILVIVVGALAGLITFRLAADGKLPVKTNSGGLVATGNQTQTVVDEQNAVISAVKNASPSVVAIGQSLPAQQGFNPFDPFAAPPSQTNQNNTIGTGFIVSKDGVIITNRHVVADVNGTYTVVTKDGKKLNIQKIYRDPTLDLAIIKTDGSNLSPINLGDSTSLQVGQTVIAIGNALGQFTDTVTTGVVSGLGRQVNAGEPFSAATETLDNLIQTDAAINPGNSGGPLLNSAGQVIGVDVATTQGAQNIGFAVPINSVKTLVDEFQRTGTISRPFIGVSYNLITRDIALMNSVPQGAYVQQVIAGSPAEKAGIQAGDIITKIDNQPINSDTVISGEIQKKKVGDSVTLEIWSNGQTRNVTLQLANNNGQ
jgi:serine protease Do